MGENNLTTTRLVKEFTHGNYYDYLEWNERTQYLASGGDQGINIWSMDHDMPIYSLEQEEEEDEDIRFAWRLCTGNGEEEGGIEMARKSAKNFTFALNLTDFPAGLPSAKVKYQQRKFRYPLMGFFLSFSVSMKGIFIWNPLESEQQTRCLSDDTDIETLAFSSDGRFLAAVSHGTLMIW
ncbi:Uncharacterized protein APZ42_000942 [Daphnia magna]|uniref:Uncharacterized protein n=1 Tax=Daphnia magna TaxID=35525 RepID=A0A164JA31_9CRUS|nr:Uncharacterized protein APZ42_000942 [Daphnia magna]